MAGPFALINPFLISLCKRLTNLVSIKNPYFSFNFIYFHVSQTIYFLNSQNTENICSYHKVGLLSCVIFSTK